jgi:hypothetical protein
MCPVIDLGVDFSDVQYLDVFEPFPNGTYEYEVTSLENQTSKAGRPMLKWVLRFEHEGRANNISFYTVLPWMKDGQMDLSGCFQLVGITKNLKKPWLGQSLATEDYIGLTGKAELVQKPGRSQDTSTGEYVDDPNKPAQNDIKKFVD